MRVRQRLQLYAIEDVAEEHPRIDGEIAKLDNGAVHRSGARLTRLARVQGLLSQAPDGGQIAFDDPLVSELVAQSGWAEESGKVTLDGPRGVMLPSGVVQTLAMAVHELTTNAVKYAAFSQQTGRIDIRWRIEVPEDQVPWIHVDWKESGVETRQMSAEGGRIGNGRRLIEGALPYQFGARTTFAFEADGVRCTIALPVFASLTEEVKDGHFGPS